MKWYVMVNLNLRSIMVEGSTTEMVHRVMEVQEVIKEVRIAASLELLVQIMYYQRRSNRFRNHQYVKEKQV